MKKNILYLILAFVIIIFLIVFFSNFGYKMSPNVITVKEISTKENNMTLSIICNNEKGYFKKIRYVKSNKNIYVYVIGTGLKFMANDDEYNITFSVKDINKVYLKGQGVETLIYEYKGI